MDIIAFDLDSFRCFHKYATVLAKNHPELYAEITGKAAGKVMERLSEKAIREGYNFILEGTMGKSTYTLDVLKESGADFDIIARLMAVSKEESLLSIFERYIEMRKSMGIGRLTTVESHNNKYENFPRVASTLEGRNVEVEIFERSRNPQDISNLIMIYKTTGNSRYSSTQEALTRGRQNSRRLCMINAEKRLNEIRKEILSFGEDIGLITEFQKLELMIQKELNNQNKENGEIE